MSQLPQRKTSAVARWRTDNTRRLAGIPTNPQSTLRAPRYNTIVTQFLEEMQDTMRSLFEGHFRSEFGRSFGITISSIRNLGCGWFVYKYRDGTHEKTGDVNFPMIKGIDASLQRIWDDYPEDMQEHISLILNTEVFGLNALSTYMYRIMSGLPQYQQMIEDRVSTVTFIMYRNEGQKMQPVYLKHCFNGNELKAHADALSAKTGRNVTSNVQLQLPGPPESTPISSQDLPETVSRQKPAGVTRDPMTLPHLSGSNLTPVGPRAAKNRRAQLPIRQPPRVPRGYP